MTNETLIETLIESVKYECLDLEIFLEGPGGERRRLRSVRQRGKELVLSSLTDQEITVLRLDE